MTMFITLFSMSQVKAYYKCSPSKTVSVGTAPLNFSASITGTSFTANSSQVVTIQVSVTNSSNFDVTYTFTLGNSNLRFSGNATTFTGTIAANTTSTVNLQVVEVTQNGTDTTGITMTLNTPYSKTINLGTSFNLIFDNVAPTLSVSVSSGTTYAKSKTATITLADAISGLKAGTYTIKYAWGTSAVACADMTLSTTITAAAGDKSKTTSVTINSGTGAGKIYVCNSATIQDVVGNTLAASTTKNANMYLDNSAPVISVVDVDGKSLSTYYQTRTIKIRITDNNSKLNGETYSLKYALGSSSSNYTCDSTQMTYTTSIATTSGSATADSAEITLSGVQSSYIYICNLEDIKDALNNTLAANTTTKKAMYVDGIGPSLSVTVTDGTTYSASKVATIKLSTSYSKLVDGDYKIYYAWGTSAVSCANMTNYITLTAASSAASVQDTVTINTGTGAGKIYVCNKTAVPDQAGNELAANTTKNANMYLDNTGPTCTWGSGPTIDIGTTGTVDLTCTDTNSGLATTSLASSNFTLSNSNISITDVAVSNVTNGKKFTLTLSATTKGSTSITLKSGAVKDNVGNNSNTPAVTVYERQYYTMSFGGNGNTGGSTSSVSCSVTTGSSCNVTLPTNGFSKTSWTFNGWGTGTGSTSGTAAGQSVSISGNVTRYATWKKVVTVTFNKNGCVANNLTSSVTLYNGETGADVAIPDHTMLSGWTDQTGTGTIYFDIPLANTTASTNFYCSKNVTVTFNANGCTTADVSAPALEVFNGATSVTVNTPSHTMKTSWTDTTPSSVTLTVPSANTTASTNFTCSKTVTVTFAANGCTTAADSATITLTNGGASGSVTVPTKTMNSGWTSLGASASASATTQGTAMGSSMTISSIGSSTTSVTRYYNCSKAGPTYTVSFSNAAATGATVTSSPVSCTVATAYNGGTLGTSCNVSLPTTGYSYSGWTFNGWATSSSATSGNTGTISISSTHTRYATWKKDVTRTITYNGNGSTGGSTANSTCTATVYNGGSSGSCSISLRANGFTKTGYTFSKWAAGSTSGTQYTAGTSVSIGSDATYYAIWADTIAPSCTWGSWSVSPLEAGSAATIQLTCTDAGNGVSTTSLTSSAFTLSNTSAYTLGTITASGTAASRVFTITVTGLAAGGSGTIQLKAGQVSDGANTNSAVTSGSLTVTADDDGPIITFGTNGNTTYKKSQSTTVTVTDVSTVTTRKYVWTQTAGASASNGTSFNDGATITKNTGDGVWYLCVYAVDSRNNSTNTCSNAFYLDNTAPTITANNFCLLKGSTSNTATNYATASDANGATLTASPATISTSSLGTSNVTFTATDGAGNSSTKTVTVTVFTKIYSDGVVTTGSGLYRDGSRYIYKGSSPNNYVSYAGKTWRIISIETNGYKLILNSAYETGVTYHGTSSNLTTSNFTSMRIYTGSLSTFWNTLTDTSAINTSYPFKTGMVADGASSTSNTIADTITAENSATTTLKLGLPNISDYQRASTDSGCIDTTKWSVANASPFACKNSNWMYNSSSGYWFLNIYSSTRARFQNTTGAVSLNPTTYTYDVRPVIYLKETTTFLGSGTSSNPYTINSNCASSGISSVTCTVTTPSGYDTSKTLTITPSSTTGITYSWDNATFNSTNTKSVSAAGTYTGYIKDSQGKTNNCALVIKSATQYRTNSCAVSVTYGNWSSGSTTYPATCNVYTGDYSRRYTGTNYKGTCNCSTGGSVNEVFSSAQACSTRVETFANACSTSHGNVTNKSCNQACIYQSRTCTCSSWSGWTSWSTTSATESCAKQVQTRTAYGP